MYRLRNIAMCDYQESVTTDRQMYRQTADKVIPMCRYTLQATQKSYAGQSDPYVPLCFAGDTKIIFRCQSVRVEDRLDT